MLQVTENAATTLDEVKRQNEIPDDYGLRLSGMANPEGQLEVRIEFADSPRESDAVQEQHGTKVFLAEEVVEPLAGATLDVTVPVRADGSTAPQLVLRPQED